MKSYKYVLDIFKCGICQFLERTVKLHQNELLKMVSGSSELETCSECNIKNLKPRHSEDTCTMNRFCLCKNKRTDKRPCPNGICDFIYEGITRDHYTYSPNIKTTDISQWTKSYWDIALCYMKYKSEKAETTNLLDLLHLMAKNRFILTTMMPVEMPSDGNEPDETVVHTTVQQSIEVCKKIKRSPGRCSDNDIDLIIAVLKMINDKHAKKAISNLKKIKIKRKPEEVATEFSEDSYKRKLCSDEESFETILERNREAVTDYTRKADTELKSKGDKTDLDSLYTSVQQKVDICGTNAGKDVLYTRPSVTEMIFETNTPQKFVITKAVSHSRENPEMYQGKWDEYQWLIYNILIFFLQTQSKMQNLSNVTFSSVFVISKAFSLQELGDIFQSPELKKHHCLFIFDFRDSNIRRKFENVHESLQGHTTLTIVDSIEEIITQENKSSFVRLKLHPEKELIIENKTDNPKSRHFSKMVKNTVCKYMMKMGKNSLSKLTLENICFEDVSTKVKLSFVPNLKQLVIRSCNFTPSLPSTLHHIQIEENDKSFCLDQLKRVFKEAVQTCPELNCIETSDMRIGDIEFRIKLGIKDLENYSKENFCKTLIECTNETADEILDNSLSEIIDKTNCNFRDYEGANEVERKAILNGMCYGLGKSDPNLYVYPAVYHGEEKEEIVLVCFMNKNFDMDKECIWGNYRGFKTFQRSCNHVKPKTLCKEYPIQNTSEQEAFYENHSKNIDETIHKYSTELMKKHSNLEIIGVSRMNERSDSSLKPCIALYVRLKSFVPYGESIFPPELSHPSKRDVVFKTDVREGYFMQLADTEARAQYPINKLEHLAMGCSIGFTNNHKAASLGPFVEYDYENEKKTGFLTACHLFSLPKNAHKLIDTKVVQPSEGDACDLTRMPNQETNTSCVCGKVVASSFTDKADACLVHITDRAPCTGAFFYRSGDIRDAADIFKDTLPKYTDGSIADLGQCVGKNLVKFGRTTFMTSGQCISQNSAVKISKNKYRVICPSTGETDTHELFGQIQIMGSQDERTFSDFGDSGAGVFLVNDDESLSCVGILIGIGKTEDNVDMCFATPIETVLRSLSKDYGSEVTLKKFTN